MKLKPEQLERLKQLFDKRAFEGMDDIEIKKLLEGITDIWLTLARINIRLKNEEQQKNESTKNQN